MGIDALQSTNCSLASIAESRTQTLRNFLAILGDMVEKLLVMEQRPRWSRFAALQGPRRCQYITSAAIQSSLKSLSLWPLPEAAIIEDSAVVVYSKAASVVSHNHRNCEFGKFWIDQLQDVLKTQPLSLMNLYSQLRVD